MRKTKGPALTFRMEVFFEDCVFQVFYVQLSTRTTHPFSPEQQSGWIQADTVIASAHKDFDNTLCRVRWRQV